MRLVTSLGSYLISFQLILIWLECGSPCNALTNRPLLQTMKRTGNWFILIRNHQWCTNVEGTISNEHKIGGVSVSVLDVRLVVGSLKLHSGELLVSVNGLNWEGNRPGKQLHEPTSHNQKTVAIWWHVLCDFTNTSVPTGNTIVVGYKFRIID